MERTRFVHPSFFSGWTLGCVHFLAGTDNAARNNHFKILYKHVFNFLVYIPKGRIARSYGNSVFNFSRNCHAVYKVAAPF